MTQSRRSWIGCIASIVSGFLISHPEEQGPEELTTGQEWHGRQGLKIIRDRVFVRGAGEKFVDGSANGFCFVGCFFDVSSPIQLPACKNSFEGCRFICSAGFVRLHGQANPHDVANGCYVTAGPARMAGGTVSAEHSDLIFSGVQMESDAVDAPFMEFDGGRELGFREAIEQATTSRS